jgi:hypothetical protein
VTSESEAKNIEELSQKLIRTLQSSREIEKNILPQAKASGNYEAVRKSLIELGG